MKLSAPIQLIGLLFFVFLPLILQAQQETRYDEVFDQGQIRPHYQGVVSQWARRVHRMDAYEQQTYDRFKRGKQDSNAVNDLPRMIPKAEYDVIVRGVQQRDRAIQALLHDHYSGAKEYAKAGIIPEDVVQAIITRSGEDGYQSLIDGNSSMNYLYGPDLIRGPDGQFYVLEDNIGFVGGFGDIVLAQEISEELYPEIADQYKYTKAIEFYQRLLVKYQQQAQEFGGGKVVFYSDPNATDDSEEVRTMELFQRLGVEVLSPQSKRQLVYQDDGVYVQNIKGGPRQKVGFIVLNLEHSDADLSIDATKEKAILDSAAGAVSSKDDVSDKLRQKIREKLMAYDPTRPDKQAQLKELKKMLDGTPYGVTVNKTRRLNKGLMEAILKRKVGSSYSPGVEWVGDKQMYTFLPDCIRFFLHEEPILKNVETYMMNIPGTNKINEDILDKVFGKNRKGADLSNWVIKPVDGRGGDGIIFGSQTEAKDIPGIIKRLRESPQKIQAQRNTPPSLFPGNRIIDTRAITYSTKQGAIVSPVPWSRAANADKSRLINVSAGGAVIPVFVIEDKGKAVSSGARMCSDLLLLN
jgi:uncharacterized circularly permuted ATP-grasp superfamily protein